MKNLLYLFCFLFLISCDTDNNENKNISNESSVQILENFVNSEIGLMENNELKLQVSEEEIFNSFKKYSIENNLELQPLYGKVEKINNKNYLRFYSKDGKVSTVEIIVSEDTGRFYIGKTICTSNACSSGGGCLPDGEYCTKCTPPGTQPGSGIKGDCKRTTSS